MIGGARFSAPVQTCPGAHPTSYTMDNGFFPGVKRPGRGVDHPPPASAEVKERIELFSTSGPSWLVLGWTIPFPLREGILRCNTDAFFYLPDQGILLSCREKTFVNLNYLTLADITKGCQLTAIETKHLFCLLHFGILDTKEMQSYECLNSGHVRLFALFVHVLSSVSRWYATYGLLMKLWWKKMSVTRCVMWLMEGMWDKCLQLVTACFVLRRCLMEPSVVDF
jgi:hypothetical protein